MGKLFNVKSHAAYQRYVQELTNAITLRDWVYDPSYALGADSSVYQKVMRDPVAAHAMRFRKHLVAGGQWNVEPASDDPNDELAAKIVEELLKKIHGFTDARIRLADSIFRGSSYAYVSGRMEWAKIGSGDYNAWWVPRALVDVDRRRFRLVNREGYLCWQFWSAQRRRWEDLEHPEWFVRSVFEQTEDSLGYGRGLLDTIYFFQATKARALQSTAEAVERFGSGFLIAKVKGMRDPATGLPARGAGGRDNATVASTWATELEKHRSRNVLVMDAEDEVQLLTGFSQGWQLLREFVSYLDVSQVVAILGSTLSTMQSLGEVGSNAKALTHENSTEALVQADRKRLGEDLTRDLIGLLWEQNRFLIESIAPGAQKPRLRIVDAKRDDPKEIVEIVTNLLAAGVELKKAEVYERTGFTMPSEQDEVFGGAGSSPQQQELAGLGGVATDPSLADPYANLELPSGLGEQVGDLGGVGLDLVGAGVNGNGFSAADRRELRRLFAMAERSGTVDLRKLRGAA